MDSRRRSSLRLLAPVGIAIFAVALVVVLSGGNGGAAGGSRKSQAEKAQDLGPPAAKRHRHRSSSSGGSLPQGVYIVKQGDSLGAIAQKTGVPVTKLQDLNPGLDQFQLSPGQQIKLR